MNLCGIEVELPPYTGDASDAQLTALFNIVQGYGQVKAEFAVAVLVKEAGFSTPLSKAEASMLIDWAKKAGEQQWKVVVFRASEEQGQGAMF